jgi:hypothetical protein
MKKIIFIASVLFIASCNNETKTDEKSETSVDTVSSNPNVDLPTVENEPIQGANISQDSLAIFEDLGVDDDKRRGEAVKKVNGIFKIYDRRLPNQASYSSMKFFETFTGEFLKNVNSVDQEVRSVWTYYIAAELILRAPEDEIKNATETLQRIESSNSDWNAKQMSELKKFDAEVMEELKRIK